jgi:hypothetical protein
VQTATGAILSSCGIVIPLTDLGVHFEMIAAAGGAWGHLEKPRIINLPNRRWFRPTSSGAWGEMHTGLGSRFFV